MNYIQHNAADPEQNRLRKRDMRRLSQNQMADIRATLELPAARRFLYSLVDTLRPHQNLIRNVRSGDIGQMFYEAGLHDAGVLIMSRIDEADPKAWATMEYQAMQQRVAELAARMPAMTQPATEADGAAMETE